jgi:hypothetical protein
VAWCDPHALPQKKHKALINKQKIKHQDKSSAEKTKLPFAEYFIDKKPLNKNLQLVVSFDVER